MCRLFGLTAGDVRVRATLLAARRAGLDGGREPAQVDGLRARLVRRGRGARRRQGSGAGVPRTPTSSATPSRRSRRRSWRTCAGRRPVRAASRTRTRSRWPGAWRPTTAASATSRCSRPSSATRWPTCAATPTPSGTSRSSRVETARHDGDVGAGIASAARWIGEHCPVSSLNVVVAGARAAVGAALPRDARAARDRAPCRCRRGSPGPGLPGLLAAAARRRCTRRRCTRRRRSWSPPSGSTARTVGA